MTTLMQAVTGSLLVALFFHAAQPLLLVALLGITAVALNISVFHLGRPAYAWRALKMWRRSWLSREVLLFGLFFAALAGFTVASCLNAVPANWLSRLHLIRIGWLQHLPATTLALSDAWDHCRGFGYRRHHRQLLHLPGPSETVLEHGAHAHRLPAKRGAHRHYLACRAEHNHWRRFFPPHRCPQSFRSGRSPWPPCCGSRITLHALSGSINQPSSSIAQPPHCSICRDIEPRSSAASLAQQRFPWPGQSANSALACAAALVAVLLARYLFFVSVVPLNMALTFTRGGTH